MSKLQRVIEGFRHQVAVVVPVEDGDEEIPTGDEVSPAGALQPALHPPESDSAERDRAVLELMVLAMFSDGVSGQRERELIGEFSESRHWPSDTNFELEVDEAVARVRDAIGSADTKATLVTRIFDRLTDVADQMMALDHLEEMAGTHGEVDPGEASLIASLRDRLH